MRNAPVRNLTKGLALLLGAYAIIVRPRLLRWGATNEEVQSPFPGGAIVPGGTRSATMAVTIDAPAAAVWPWLVQMGYRRAGWYSWDQLDNLGRPSADRIHPEWQQIAIGDVLAGPEASEMEKAWTVAALEPERFLGLRASFALQGRRFDPVTVRPSQYSDSLWGFMLTECPAGRTRLVVSGYWSMQPRWLGNVLSVTFVEWAHWIMQTRQFTSLKRLAQAQVAR